MILKPHVRSACLQACLRAGSRIGNTEERKGWQTVLMPVRQKRETTNGAARSGGHLAHESTREFRSASWRTSRGGVPCGMRDSPAGRLDHKEVHGMKLMKITAWGDHAVDAGDNPLWYGVADLTDPEDAWFISLAG